MKRRHVLSVLAGLSASGCLAFQESSSPPSPSGSDQSTETPDAASTQQQGPATSTSLTPEGSTGTPASSRPGQQGTSTPAYATTAAELTTVQSFSNDLTALASHGASYAIGTGDQIQVRDFGSSKPTTTIESPGSNAVLELTASTLTVGVSPTETERSTIYRFDPATGEQRAEAQLTGDIELITAVGDALVCGTVTEPSDDDEQSVNRIALLETADLSQRWTNTVKNRAFPEETAQVDETLHIGFENFLVGFDMADGTIQYRAPLNVGYPTAYEGDLIADADRKLRRINPQTLDYEWSTGTEVSGRPVIVGDLVAVPTTNGILAADRESGEKRWSRTLEDVSGYTPELLAYHDGLFWYGTADEQLYGLVPTTGETAFSMAADVDFLTATANGVVANSDFDIMELTVSTTE